MSVEKTRQRTDELLASGWGWQTNDDHEIWLELRLGKKVIKTIWPDGERGIGQLSDEEHQQNLELGRSVMAEQEVINKTKGSVKQNEQELSDLHD